MRASYEAEFMRLAGETLAVVTLRRAQVRPIQPRDVAHVRELAAPDPSRRELRPPGFGQLARIRALVPDVGARPVWKRREAVERVLVVTPGTEIASLRRSRAVLA